MPGSHVRPSCLPRCTANRMRTRTPHRTATSRPHTRTHERATSSDREPRRDVARTAWEARSGIYTSTWGAARLAHAHTTRPTHACLHTAIRTRSAKATRDPAETDRWAPPGGGGEETDVWAAFISERRERERRKRTGPRKGGRCGPPSPDRPKSNSLAASEASPHARAGLLSRPKPHEMTLRALSRA